ncbi:CLIP domain-containing serine protease 14D-like [Homalodisca vitripennis]|uniref:CLIP domain-containing serine protease 14D-like n=1 Tax=Homalodisca vitripennis TaxID=197043 RepID=UPI001EEBFC32|nr:CLIP domain-containing serine protease 14D-like [Homalodisca vitripennis]
MAVKVPVVSKGECEISYTDSQYYWFVCPRGVTCHVISDKQLCAGGIQGEVTCDGDSGGPLMMSDGLNPTTYYVVGITSYGLKKKDRSCVSGVPDVFTRVSEYIPWILDTIY